MPESMSDRMSEHVTVYIYIYINNIYYIIYTYIFIFIYIYIYIYIYLFIYIYIYLYLYLYIYLYEYILNICHTYFHAYVRKCQYPCGDLISCCYPEKKELCNPTDKTKKMLCFYYPWLRSIPSQDFLMRFCIGHPSFGRSANQIPWSFKNTAPITRIIANTTMPDTFLNISHTIDVSKVETTNQNTHTQKRWNEWMNGMLRTGTSKHIDTNT